MSFKPLKSALVLGLLFSQTTFADSNFTFKGDFRFRTEEIKDEQASPLPEGDRTRQRIRLRAGGTAVVNDETDVVMRLATGTATNTENNSTNQDLTDYESKKAILIDMAYFNFHPNENTQIWGGKTPIQYFTALSSDLVIDSDVTPEGMALKYKNGEFFVNAGTDWVSERYSATGATDNTDVGLVGLQGGYTHKTDSCDFTVAVEQLNYANIKGATAPAAKGNTLVGAVYKDNYKLNVLDAEFNTTISGLPVGFGVEMVNNTEVSDYNNGSNFGVRVGKLKEKGSWMVAADYRELQKDAALGMLSESDSSGGGTDIRTTKVVYGYQLGEKANVMFTYMWGQHGIASTTFTADYTRMDADFNFSF
ncbi:MAG: putative porin [Pseudobdellovibrio sp.]